MVFVVVLAATDSTTGEAKFVTAIDCTTSPVPDGFNITDVVVGTTDVTGVIEAGVTVKEVTGLKDSDTTLTDVGKDKEIKLFSTELIPTLNEFGVLEPATIIGENAIKSFDKALAETGLSSVTLIDASSKLKLSTVVIRILVPLSTTRMLAILEELAAINIVPVLSNVK